MKNKGLINHKNGDKITIKNITSEIEVEKTIMKIEKILIDFGAQGILKEYTGHRIKSLSFYISRDGQNIPFKLPMNLESARRVVKQAAQNRKIALKFLEEPHTSDKAEKVGWRVIKDWIHAQLSLIEIDFADPVELLLPYVYDTATKQTFFEKIKQNPQMLLGSGEKK